MDATFTEVIEAVDRLAQLRETSSVPAQVQAVREIERRLRGLQSSYARLMSINAELMHKMPLKTTFDSASETYIASLGDQELRIKLNRADPQVPIQMKRLTEGVAYLAGSQHPADDPNVQALRDEMEHLLEYYYYAAHRTLKLVQSLPKLKNFKAKEISIVRNKLIEHAEHGDLYSFGYGSTGPRIKPVGPATRQWNDEGLSTNTGRFLSALKDALGRSAPRDA